MQQCLNSRPRMMLEDTGCSKCADSCVPMHCAGACSTGSEAPLITPGCSRHAIHAISSGLTRSSGSCRVAAGLPLLPRGCLLLIKSWYLGWPLATFQSSSRLCPSRCSSLSSCKYSPAAPLEWLQSDRHGTQLHASWSSLCPDGEAEVDRLLLGAKWPGLPQWPADTRGETPPGCGWGSQPAPT